MANLEIQGDIRPEDVLLLFAAVLASAGAVIFGLELSTLSPVTKIVVLTLISLGAFDWARNADRPVLLDFTAAVFLVSALAHLHISFQPPADILALLLVATSAAAVGAARYSKRLDPGRKLKVFLGATLLLAVLLTAVDVSGSQPSYVVNLQDSVEPDNQVAGTLVAQNSFFLPRNSDLPEYRVCDYPGQPELKVSVGNGRRLLPGGEVVQHEIRIMGELNSTWEVASMDGCPPESGGRILIVQNRSN